MSKLLLIGSTIAITLWVAVLMGPVMAIIALACCIVVDVLTLKGEDLHD